MLYDDPVTAPQFETTGHWRADSIRVAGTDAYVDGEYLYQSWPYDDHGTSTSVAGTPPEQEPNSNSFGAMSGDVVYPIDEATYANNAADLLEFRAQPKGNEVLYRITLTTMVEPDAAGVAIGIDTGTGSQTDWGYGLGELGAPVDHVLVTNGEQALLDGEPIPSSVDLDRNQIEVRMPRQPGEEMWRHYCVTGLVEADSLQFKQVQREPSETHPGGANGQNPPPVFDVGFRTADQEPMSAVGTSFVNPWTGSFEPGGAVENVEAATEVESRGSGVGHWREHAQATSLSDRDISAFHADINFGKLRRQVTDRNVPQEGYLNLLYSSRYRLGDGIKDNVILGRVHPYTLYVPSDYDGSSAPLQLYMAGTTATYNTAGVSTPNILREFGEESGGLVLVPEARGPDIPYRDEAELDVFEALNDASHRFEVDFEQLYASGYSRGGYGTYRLMSLYPDLFVGGFSIVGTPGASASNLERSNVTSLADNLRHNPLLIWVGTADTILPYPFVFPYQERLRELGYEHRFDTFPDYDHFRFGLEDEWEPAREYLADRSLTKRPRRITYRREPLRDAREFGLVHDGAYWINDIVVVDGADDGLLDATSYGISEPITEPVRFNSAGDRPSPHQRRGVRLETVVADPPTKNRLELTLSDVQALTVYIDEAGLNLESPLVLEVESDADVAITLVGSSDTTTVELSAGMTEQTI